MQTTLLDLVKAVCHEQHKTIAKLCRALKTKSPTFYAWTHSATWFDHDLREKVAQYLQLDFEKLKPNIEVKRATPPKSMTSLRNTMTFDASVHGSFQWRIYKLLIEKGWSLQFLAEYVDTYQDHLRQACLGKARLNINVYNKLCSIDKRFELYKPWAFVPHSQRTDAGLRKLIALKLRTQEQIESEYPKMNYADRLSYINHDFYTQKEKEKRAQDV